MGRKANPIKRRNVLIRFEPDVLQVLDTWDGGPDRGAKLHRLIREAIDAGSLISQSSALPEPS